MTHTPTHTDDRREDSGSFGQSVAVAVASALILFTVVGLIASRTAVSSPRAGLAPSVFAIGVPSTQRQALQQAAVRVQLQGVPEGNSFSITVPARQAVLLETGLQTGCVAAGSDSGTMLIPPLEPGHHILNVGMHDVLVTAVVP